MNNTMVVSVQTGNFMHLDKEGCGVAELNLSEVGSLLEKGKGAICKSRPTVEFLSPQPPTVRNKEVRSGITRRNGPPYLGSHLGWPATRYIDVFDITSKQTFLHIAPLKCLFAYKNSA